MTDHLTWFLRNLYADQEATVRTGHGTTEWFQIGKGVHQGCILSTCLFNLYAKYIIRNAGLDEAQAGIKITGRNINNVRYANDTTLMAESKEELKSLLMKVQEESEKVGLKLNIQKTKIMASGPINSWQIDRKQWKQWETLFRWAAAICALNAGERSYPTSEVRGSGRECQAATAQERPRGATPRPRSGATDERSYPTSEVRGGGREEPPHT